MHLEGVRVLSLCRNSSSIIRRYLNGKICTLQIRSYSPSKNDDDDGDDGNFDKEQDEPHPDLPYAQFHNEHYIPTTFLQKTVLAVGTGLASFFDPTRAENIAVFGEITAEPALNYLYKKMKSDSEGQQILEDKPRINSSTVDLKYLESLGPETLGRTYVEFLKAQGITPDSRLPVRFIKDPELAYVMQRYREIHDLVHAVANQPTNMLGEVTIKWVEGLQTGLPMCVTGGIFGATRLRPKQRAKYIQTHLPWAIRVGLNSKLFLNIYYENRWEDSIAGLRNYISPLLLHPPQ